MGWLALGVLYSAAYAFSGIPLSTHTSLVWFRSIALLAPPLFAAYAIFRRRDRWSGCQWLFWATLALGLLMSSLGLIGWMIDDLLLDRPATWLGWHGVFALFGAAAPLLALVTQPHRGSRESIAATAAVDLAGIAVLTGFLYSHFVVATDVGRSAAETVSMPLLILSEVQQLLVLTGMTFAAFAGRATPWAATYRRLALGMVVSFVTLTLTNIDIWQGIYRPGFVYDFTWILPFAFYPWALDAAPRSDGTAQADDRISTPSRPWVIFAVLVLIPIIDYGLRWTVPPAIDAFQDLSTAVTVVSALSLLMARLAVERSEVGVLAAAAEQADELIFILRLNGRFQYANQAFLRHTGYSRAELSTLAFSDVLEEASSVEAAIFEAATTGPSWRGTLIHRRKDGSTFPASSTIVRLRDFPVSLAHFVGVERNVTQDLKLREQLIHTERLSAVGQLASGVAHELNNPLQSIMAFCDILLETERRAQTRRDLGQIRSETERAGKIVRNLLTFVRRSASQRTTADLNDIVRRTVALRGYELAIANIDVEEQYTHALPPVVVNREEIQQVILNLILNAEQAMREDRGHGRVVIRTAAHNGSVTCEIEDNGPGIPASLAGQIFEPFFTTKEVGSGTGLGLSIALGIAQSHKGALELVPATSGSCFRLTLPVSDAAAVASEPAEQRTARRTTPRRSALVVDDERAVRQSLRRVLLSRRFSVDLAKDGEAASALLNVKEYDLVLCDVRMPKMGGVALYRFVQTFRPANLNGFGFISGDILNLDIQQLVEHAGIPLLSKPFTAEQLDSLLDAIESNSSGARR